MIITSIQINERGKDKKDKQCPGEDKSVTLLVI